MLFYPWNSIKFVLIYTAAKMWKMLSCWHKNDGSLNVENVQNCWNGLIYIDIHVITLHKCLNWCHSKTPAKKKKQSVHKLYSLISIFYG